MQLANVPVFLITALNFAVITHAGTGAPSQRETNTSYGFKTGYDFTLFTLKCASVCHCRL